MGCLEFLLYFYLINTPRGVEFSDLNFAPLNLYLYSHNKAKTISAELLELNMKVQLYNPVNPFNPQSIINQSSINYQ